MRDPSMDAEVKRLYKDLLPRVSDYVDKWAQERPHEPALIEYNTGEVITWKKFALSTKAFAAKLLAMGLRKGDIVATMLPLLKEHVFLMYACYRIGVIIAPLDLRLKAHELNRCFDKMHPKAFFFLGKTPVADFRPLVQEIMKAHPECKAWIQFQQENDLILEGAWGIAAFAADIKKVAIKAS